MSKNNIRIIQVVFENKCADMPYVKMDDLTLNMTFKPEYKDKTSTEYQALASKIEIAVENTLLNRGKTATFIICRIEYIIRVVSVCVWMIPEIDMGEKK